MTSYSTGGKADVFSAEMASGLYCSGTIASNIVIPPANIFASYKIQTSAWNRRFGGENQFLAWLLFTSNGLKGLDQFD